MTQLDEVSSRKEQYVCGLIIKGSDVRHMEITYNLNETNHDCLRNSSRGDTPDEQRKKGEDTAHDDMGKMNIIAQPCVKRALSLHTIELKKPKGTSIRYLLGIKI